MQHLDLRLGRRRFLVCEPETTASGKSAAYGAFLRSVDQAIRNAAALGATLYLLPPPRPINAAIYDLESPDVRIVGQSGWQPTALRALWWVATPVRYGAPWSWLTGEMAGRARRVVEAGKVSARQRGWRTLDRTLDKWGHACRRVAHRYEKRAADAWRALCAEARERARATDSKKQRVRLRLRPAAQARVEQLAREAGVDPAKPIVTLHVRESGYRQRSAERQQTGDRLRDAQIATYRSAVDWLVPRGYQVVRLGDATMTPCPWPGVIDLATATWRIPAFELWAVLNAGMSICGDSGPYLLGLLSGAPAVSVNVFRVGYNTIGAKDLYIVKRVFDRVQGRFLAIAEQLEESFLRGDIDLERYEWTDNTAEEILEAVQDMVQAIGDPGLSRTDAQQRHDRLIADLDKRWNPEWPSERLLFRRGGRGTMAPRFAARHLDQ